MLPTLRLVNLVGVVGTTWAWRAWRESRVAEVQVRAKRKARMRGGYHERGAEGKIRIAEEL
jgi:hypothetical protein